MSFLLGFLIGTGNEVESTGGYCIECPINDVKTEEYPDPND